MSRTIFSLACLLVVAIGCASADEPERIVGGFNAAPGEYPFTVSIQVYDQHFCGGAIISESHILTAAHCLVPLQNDPYVRVTILSGTNNNRRGGQTHEVDAMYSHPQYNTVNLWYADIGVIKLVKPMKFNRFQNKINLATSSPAPGSNPVVTAWGYTGVPPQGKASDELQKLHLNIIDLATCRAYHRHTHISDIMICTFNRPGEGTCSGDSGSPLVYNNEVVGVVSGGIPCARGFPDIFSNVYNLLDFVHYAMQL